MPIFEYICHNCKAHFEVLHSADAKNIPACPKCCSGDVRKLFSVFASQVGGSTAGSMSSPSNTGCSDGRGFS